MAESTAFGTFRQAALPQLVVYLDSDSLTFPLNSISLQLLPSSSRPYNPTLILSKIYPETSKKFK